MGKLVRGEEVDEQEARRAQSRRVLTMSVQQSHYGGNGDELKRQGQTALTEEIIIRDGRYAPLQHLQS